MEARPYCGVFVVVLLLLQGASPEDEGFPETDTPTPDDDPSGVTTSPPPATARLGNLLADHASNALNAFPPDSVDHVNSIASAHRVIDRASRFLQKNGFDPYFLDDLLIQGRSVSPFRVPGRSRVLLQDGRLFGMSDFRSMDYSSKMADESSQQQQLWLTWRHLRATFRVTIDVEGLRDVGDLDVRAGRLMMHVQPSASDSSRPPKVETSKIRRFECRLSGLETSPDDDVRGAICLEAESGLRTLLNGKVRHVLLNTVRRAVSEDSTDNELSPLRTLPAKFFEVDF